MVANTGFLILILVIHMALAFLGGGDHDRRAGRGARQAYLHARDHAFELAEQDLGAAGQAIQNMNIMAGLPEATGLR